MNGDINRSPAAFKLAAKSIIARHGPKVLVTALLLVLAQFAISMLVSELSGYSAYVIETYNMMISGESYVVSWPKVEIPAIVICVVLSIMSGMMSLGYSWYALRTVRGEVCGFRDIFEIFNSFGKVFLIQLLTGVIVALGTVFFVIPGIMAAYSYRMAIYVAYDEPELSAWGCMRRSSEIMRGKRFSFFMLELSFILWNIANALLATVIAPVLDVWLLPYTQIAYTLFYIYNATGGMFVVNEDTGDGDDEEKE